MSKYRGAFALAANRGVFVLRGVCPTGLLPYNPKSYPRNNNSIMPCPRIRSKQSLLSISSVKVYSFLFKQDIEILEGLGYLMISNVGIWLPFIRQITFSFIKTSES